MESNKGGDKSDDQVYALDYKHLDDDGHTAFGFLRCSTPPTLVFI